MIIFNLTKSNLLSENDRKHWAAKAPVVKTLRTLSKIQHRAAINRGDYRPFDRARLVVWITWPDGRRRDAHNTLPTLKALIDGAVDAGMIKDDSDRYLQGPDLRTIQGVRCDKRYAVKFEFCWTEVEDDEPADLEYDHYPELLHDGSGR